MNVLSFKFLLFRLKSSISAVGSAIAGSFDMQQPESIPQNYGRPQYPPALSDRPFNPSQGGSGYPPAAGVAGGQYPPRGSGYPGSTSGYGQPQQEEGIFSKMKNMFTGDGGTQQNLPPLPPRHIPPPPPGYNRLPQQGMGGPPPLPGQQQSSFPPPPRPTEYGGGVSTMPPPPSSSSGFGSPPGRPFDQQQPPPPGMMGQQHMYGQAPPPPIPVEPPAIDWQQVVPPEPQLIVHEDCVVLIFKPQEFHRKKAEMTAAGPSAIQVFADFEGVFTKFRAADNQRAANTAELLESADILTPGVKAQIQNVYNEENEGRSLDGYAFSEELAKKCQSIIASNAQLHIANVMLVTKSFLSSGKLSLRESWRELLQVLSIKSVPFFLFSSGYGDIVANALIGSGLPPTTTGAPLNQAPGSSPLPTNLRIISNFFRTGPDGTVRAFSQPMVHDQNKNMSTAEAFMNMPAPQRAHALLLAAHEDDVAMIEGLQGK